MQMIDKVCFFVGGNCVINEDADVCDAGYEHCSPGHTYGPSIRDYVLIHIVKSGKGIFCAGNTTYHLSKNKAFVIRPDTLHSYTADTSDPWHYLWVGFRGKGAGALCEKAFGQTECVFDVDADLAFELERILIEKDDEIKTIFSLTGFIYRLLRAPPPCSRAARYRQKCAQIHRKQLLPPLQHRLARKRTGHEPSALYHGVLRRDECLALSLSHRIPYLQSAKTAPGTAGTLRHRHRFCRRIFVRRTLQRNVQKIYRSFPSALSPHCRRRRVFPSRPTIA